MARQKPNPFVTKAQQLAILRYGPQISGIAALQRQAAADYRTLVQNARGARKATQAAIDEASPKIGGAYQAAGQQMGNVNAIVDQDLAKIGPVSGQSAALQQAIQLERQNSGTGLATLQAAAEQGLRQQGIDAVTGRNAAIKRAKTQRADTYNQLLNQLSDVAKERGTFISSTAQDLASAQSAAEAKAAQHAADQAQALLIAKIQARTSRGNSQRQQQTSEANAQRSADATIQAAKIRAGAAGGAAAGLPKGVKPATPTQQGGFQDDVKYVFDAAKTIMSTSKNTRRRDAAQILLQGAPSGRTPVLDKNGRKVYDRNGVLKTRTVPGIKAATKSPLVLKAALDMAYDGRLSVDTANQIRRRGYSLKALGLPYNTKEGQARKARGAARVMQAGAGSDALARLLGLLGG